MPDSDTRPHFTKKVPGIVKRGFISLLIIIFLVLLLAFVVIKYRLTPVIESNFRSELEQHNIQNLVISSPDISINGLRFDKVSLSGKSRGIAFELEAKTLVVSYSIDLLIHGNIDRLHIDRLTANLLLEESRELPTRARKHIDGIAAIGLFPKHLFDLIPLNRISIEQIAIQKINSEDSTNLPSPLLNARLFIRKEKNLIQFSTDMDLTFQQKINKSALTLTGKLDRIGQHTNQLSAMLHNGPNTLLDISAQSSVDTKDKLEIISFEANANYNNIHSWLNAITNKNRLVASLVKNNPFLEIIMQGELSGSTNIAGLMSAPIGGESKPSLSNIELSANSSHKISAKLHSQIIDSIDFNLRKKLSLRDGLFSISNIDSNGRALLTLNPNNSNDISKGVSSVLYLTSFSFSKDMATEQEPHLSSSGILEFSRNGTRLSTGYDLSLSMKKESLEGNFTASSQELFDITDGKLKYSTNDKIAAVTFRASSQYYARALCYFEKLDLPPENLEIAEGSFNAEVEISAKTDSTPFLTNFNSKLSFEIDNLTGIYEDMAFSGLSASGTLNTSGSSVKSDQIIINLDKFDPGFPASNLVAQFSLQNGNHSAFPILRLNTLETDLFGGHARLIKPVKIDFSKNDNLIELNAENLSLAEMLAIEKKDINVSGKISGLLPIKVGPDSITIENGRIKSLNPGGIIQYLPETGSEALSSSSNEMGLFLGIAENFHYDVISSDVNLDNQGILYLGIAIKGRNPDKHEGRPVHLNINLEDNIAPLLQQQRVQSDLVSKIEDSINKQMVFKHNCEVGL